MLLRHNAIFVWIGVLLGISLYGCGPASSLQSATPIVTPSQPVTGGSETNGTPSPKAELTATSISVDSLYPPPPASFETFKQYPGAQYLEDSTSGPEYLLFIELETNDDPEVAEAYYHELAQKQGWQSVATEGTSARYPNYYYGDYGKAHVYGYYLNFFATDRGRHLKTYIRLSIHRSLPIYLGAYDVVADQESHIDTALTSVKFSIDAPPGAVLAFYRDLLPADNWELDTSEISDTQLIWRIGASSYASVTAMPQSTGETYVVVQVYSGCCG